MPDARTCQNCGSAVPIRSPESLCPRCMLMAGMDNGSTSALPPAPSVLETIGATIGGVPRVLLRDTALGEEPSPIIRPTNGNETSTRYRIDGEIARGGMGSILKGRDPDLGRDVALKVLREDHRDNDDLVRRFVEEAQIGGQLQHPGVVPIYELGTFADRRPFFSMKLVKGQTLADLLADRSTPADDLPRFLAIFASIAQTMAYTHTRGVIHRDLKPSNVMVGAFGEVQVMDWGLAKVLARGGIVNDAKAGKEKPPETLIATARSGSDIDLSHAGSILGTPSYMPPDQARGESELINERADVFALGSILGEILTGSPAFTGRNSGEIVRKASRGDTADALTRLDACGADGELIALVKDCLAVEPDDRPRDATVVADRITAYLAGVQERVQAAERERAVAVARAVEERKQRRLQVGLAASLIGLMALGGGGYAWVQRQTTERVARTARAVDEALADAARLRGEAQAAPPGETTRWSDALAAAKRAEGLLDQGESDAPLRGRVVSLLAQLDRERGAAAFKAGQLAAEHALLAELESIRGNRADHWEPKQTDTEYAAAFRKAGLDLDKTDPAESGKWIAARSEPVELAGYLDDWAFVRRTAKRSEADWRRLVAAARAADPDPWRDALRARVGTTDASALAEFRRLADDDKALDAQTAPSLILLAVHLRNGASDRERAARVLRRAVARHPAEFWAQYELSRVHGADSGQLTEMYPRPEESVRHLTAAVAIRPQSPGAHSNLGLALGAQGKLDEAIAEYREAIRLKPDSANAHDDLGLLLRFHGKLDLAVAESREAIRLDPDSANAHTNLGNALSAQGKIDEAIAEHREAIRIKPDFANAHSNLGIALYDQGTFDLAVAEHREAIRLKPDLAEAHSNLGLALKAQGKLDLAIAEYREAIRLRRDFDKVHANLGMALSEQGKLDLAVAEFREAIRIKPDFDDVHNFLRTTLHTLGKLDEEATELRVQLERARKKYGPSDSRTAGSLAELGRHFVQQGLWSEADPVLRECLAIREKTQPDVWTTFNTRSTLGGSLLGQGKYALAEPLIIAGYEGLKARAGTVPTGAEMRLAEAAERVVQLYDAWGKKDNAAQWRARLETRAPAEWLGVAALSIARQRFAAAARGYAKALEADPKLGESREHQHRYNAACVAALAASGQARDDPPPDDDARAKFRNQSLEWLKAELVAWAKVLGGDVRNDRREILRAFRHWKVDTDLASIRDPEPLAKLSESEQKAWRTLWADAEALLKRAEAQAP